MAKRRRRGVVLTPEGLEKFQVARLKHEAEENYGERYTYEKLSELTYLDIHTIKRVIECQEGVDKRTLERLFISFNIELLSSCFTKPNPHRRQHWGDAMCVSTFFGRTEELTTLESWLLKERCRVITVLGMGGMGKTCLTVKLAKDIQGRFDMVMWCSLRDAPPATDVITRIIEFLSDEKDIAAQLPESIAGKTSKLIEYLRASRCLILLDNMESLLCDSQRAGIFREGYEDYGDLLLRLGETEHLSSVIVTTREKPREVAYLEGEGLPVRTFRIQGLGEEAGESILKLKKLQGDKLAYHSLIEYYDGNALALKVVATTIQELFGGDIKEFLNHETAVFGDIRDLLEQQFNRLTDLEQEMVYWLAINREPLTIAQVREDMVTKVSKLKIIEALESLSRRSLVERDQTSFTLQNVVMEYVICRFILRVCDELINFDLKLFRYHAVIKATAKDYVRETQIRLILEPLLEELEAEYKSKDNVINQLKEVLSFLRKNFPSEACYGGGNLINMLCHMEADFTGCDFSKLSIWQADFRNSCFHDVNLSNCNLSKSVFAETFGGVLSVAFSPDGKLLAKGDMNGEIRLYRVSDWQQVSFFKGHGDWVTSIAFNPSSTILATASLDKKVKLWALEDSKLLQELHGHSNSVESVVFSSDGKLLASGSDDYTVKIWNVATSEEIKTLQENDMVRAVSFSPNSEMLFSGSLDKSVKLWNISSGECVKKFVGHNDGIWAIAISSDGQILASASSDQSIRLWNVESGKCFNNLKGHKDSVWSVAINADNKILASGSWDRTVKLWDLYTGKCLKNFEGHSSLVRAITFSPNSELLISGSDDQTLKLWNLKTKSCLRTFQGHSDSSWSISICSDNQTLVSSGDNASVKLWDIHTAQCIKAFKGHTNTVRAVAFSPDGNTIASGSDDHIIRLWNRNTGQSKILNQHTSWVWSVAFSPDGKLFASGSSDQTLKIWNIENSQCIKTLNEEGHSILSISFSPNGKLIVTSSADHTVKVWNISAGKCVKTLKGHEGWVWSVTFSPDGKNISSGSLDGTIRLWDIETGKCLRILQEHKGWLWSVAFSPSGKMLASGSADRTIKLWNVNNGECFTTLKGHESGILSVIFDYKGHYVISSSEDETIRFWDISTGECTKIIRSKKPYEKMLIEGTKGLTESRIDALKSLGAVALSKDKVQIQS
ncbi:MAG: NB-ARC domain-containing protein [Cyanobacteria bacterium P01_A01_bin.83]